MSKWKVFEKRSRSGKYSYYKSDPCIIVASNRRFVITYPLFELMGKPDRVLMLSDGGGRLGFRGVTKKDPQFEEAYAFSTTGEGEGAVHYLNAGAFIRENNLRENSVCKEIYIEDDIVIANKSDFQPARYKA